jgi:hypothetical protein
MGLSDRSITARLLRLSSLNLHSLTLFTHQLSDRAGQRRVRLLRVLVALRRAGRQVRRARLHRLHGEAPSAPAFISSDLSV